MKYGLLAAAISAAVALSPAANAGPVDCGVSPTTCDLPVNTTVTNTNLVTLTLDNTVKSWVMAADDGGFGIGQTLGQLPFIMIDTAPANSLWVGANGNVGMGGILPNASLKVSRANGSAKILVEEDQVAANPLAPQVMFELRRSGALRFDLVDESNSVTWVFQNRDGAFDITKAGTGVQEFKLDGSGNLTIQGALQQLSDVNSKEDFQPVSGASVLADIGRLSITKWRYKDDPVGYQHIGPTAQDFRAVFNVGSDEKSIAPLDVASVAVAGVKELHTMVADQQAQLAAKDAELAAMNARMAELEDSMNRLLMTMQHAAR
jgi:hypothetical protein